jgi:WD40 repeat protein
LHLPGPLWDTRQESPLRTRVGADVPNGFVAGVALSPDGQQLAGASCGEVTGGDVVGCVHGIVLTWDLAAHQQLGVVLNGPSPAVDAFSALGSSMSEVSFSSDGRLLAAGDDHGEV